LADAFTSIRPAEDVMIADAPKSSMVRSSNWRPLPLKVDQFSVLQVEDDVCAGIGIVPDGAEDELIEALAAYRRRSARLCRFGSCKACQ
jgi:hypothetical protein